MMVGKPMKQTADPIPYDETVTIATEIDGRSLQVVTKPGVPGWDELNPATFLLAEAAAISPESRVLVMGSPHGALATGLARRAASGEVVVFDRNVVVQECARLTLAGNGVENSRVLLSHSAIVASLELFDIATLEI